MNPQDFEGTWVMRTHRAGFNSHELKIAVTLDSQLRGSWSHLNGAGRSSIEGGISGDSVQLHRFSSNIDQTYVGRFTPTFAGGTFTDSGGGDTGVWFMEKQ